MPYPMTLATMLRRSRRLSARKKIVSGDHSGIRVHEDFVPSPEAVTGAGAAVIAIPHEKRAERPMACVVRKPDRKGTVPERKIPDRRAARGRFPLVPRAASRYLICIPRGPAGTRGPFQEEESR